MGLRFTSQEKVVALYDSVTDWAFGPIFYTEEAADKFLTWANDQGVPNGDVRSLLNVELSELWERYRQENEDARGYR